MKKICLLYLFIVALSACGGKKFTDISLHGDIQGLGNDTILLFGADKLYDHMDTILTEKGKFSVTLSTDTLVATVLLFSDGTEYPLYLNKGDELQIKGSAANLSALDVSGNTPNEELTVFNQELKGLGKPSARTLEKKAETFIQTHPSSLVSIHLLEKYFVQSLQPDFAQIKRLVEHMNGELKDRPSVDALLEYIQNEEKVAVGQAAPYFHLPNANKKQITRSDFSDKYLLIHFWASWDEASRQANAMYRRLYQKELKNKKFALLGISLDMDSKEWKEAIKKDTLKWEQTCDFSGWSTEAARLFAIQRIPANLLISPAGRIEGKGLDENTLLQKLKEIAQAEKDKKMPLAKKTIKRQ